MKRHKDKYMDIVKPGRQLSEHYWMRCVCPGCDTLRKELQLKYNRTKLLIPTIITIIPIPVKTTMNDICRPLRYSDEPIFRNSYYVK